MTAEWLSVVKLSRIIPMSVAPLRSATPEYRAKLDELHASLEKESILEQAAKTHSGIAANRHGFLGRYSSQMSPPPRSPVCDSHPFRDG